jgi:hypothetical protein
MAKLDPKKLQKAFLGILTVVIIAVAIFQIQRLSRQTLHKTVQKYSDENREGDDNALERSTADAPPPSADAPEGEAPAAEPPPADAPAADPSG